MADHELQFGGGASSSNPDGSRRFWVLIWQAKVPQKMKIHAWKACSGALATAKGKSDHHLQTRASCPMCGVHTESSFQALVTCDHATRLRDCMRLVEPLPARESLRDTGQDWLL